jgi:hypothetical protein
LDTKKSNIHIDDLPKGEMRLEGRH